MEEIEFSRWLFEGRLRQGKNMLADGLNWLCYFAGNSSSRHEKRCQILQTLFWVFQYSRNSQCSVASREFFQEPKFQLNDTLSYSANI